MMQKRLKLLVIGGVVPVALDVSGSPSAGAATGNGGSLSSVATLHTSRPAAEAGAATRLGVQGGAGGTANPLRDRPTRELWLTDHEQYVRHHQRLATLASRHQTLASAAALRGYGQYALRTRRRWN
jgi:hypothetical protein